MPNLARVVGGLALAVAVLASCGSGGGPATFTASFAPIGSGHDPVPISLIDQAGVVTGIDPVIGAASGPAVAAVPGHPMTLRVSWVAGECTDRVTLVLNGTGPGYELAIHNHEGITAFTCTAAGIPRALNVAFNKLVVPDQLAVSIQFP